MDIRFDDKIVVVSGASWGLGRRIVERFLECGARVFCSDNRADGLEIVQNKGADIAVLDLTDRAKAAAWIADIESRTGSAVDVLVNNAGGFAHAVPRPLEDVTDSEWDTVMAINPGIAFTLSRAVARSMKKAKRGRIVNVSSGAGLHASRTKLHPYTAAKHAVVGLTRQMAAEFGEFGITVNGVAPGFVISSPFTQADWDRYSPEAQNAHIQGTFMRRVGVPDDIASAILFFASDYASWISGEVLSIDGGR
jgi:3-oxoacyl-[acyl-carrier protein] reductase